MKIYAIFQNVQHGTSFERRYIGKCMSETNLSRITGIAGFTRADGTPCPNEYVHFSADKAARSMLQHLPLVEVDELGNCDFII